MIASGPAEKKDRKSGKPTKELFPERGVAMAQHVVYNYMPGTDFSKYHTYKWVAIEGGANPN